MRRLIRIYDTTLRDGTQGEGVSFSMEDKVRLTTRLDAFGIHYIEGGWPGSNPKDLRFFRRMQDVDAQARQAGGVLHDPAGRWGHRIRPQHAGHHRVGRAGGNDRRASRGTST